ncbi:MAG: polymerase primary sigma factor [Thermodesulfobacteriota bacterium]|nr:polymerase primary sigma factor [Thermodesulfobacteriota bacterium]
MIEAKTSVEFKELFDLARARRYLTYDEINELLPSHVVAIDQIDELLIKIMADHNCELVASEKKIPVTEKKARALDEEKPEEEEDEEEIIADPESVVRGNDPVKMYLHEMGCVSLLTREGEVEIAKRIEQGEQQVFGVIIECPVTIKEVLALGDKLQKGTIRLKEVIRGFDEEEVAEGDDSTNVEKVLKLIEEMKDFDAKYHALLDKRNAIPKDTPEEVVRDMDQEVAASKEQVVACLRSLNLNTNMIDHIAGKLKFLVQKLESARDELWGVEYELKAPAEDIRGKIAFLKKLIDEKKAIKKYTHLSPHRIYELEKKFESGIRKIQKLRGEAGMDEENLVKALESCRQGEYLARKAKSELVRPISDWS